MIDPLPDARLRDDVAQQIFTQAMGESQGLGGTPDFERKTLLESVALISFEAAEAFVRTRRLFDQKRRA